MTVIPKRETWAIKSAKGMSASLAERANDKSPSLNNAVAKALRTPGIPIILADLSPIIKASGSFLFMTKTISSCAIRNASLGLFFKPLTFTVFMGLSYRKITRVHYRRDFCKTNADKFYGAYSFSRGALIVIHNVQELVIPAGKRVSSAMDGKLKSIHGAWIPAIHAGMTIFENIDHVL